ncbi:DNA-binding protein [Ottowia testudinis]|uniref:DNA-binding protein n=1 Tax=Ottowia testudinis TaxID=2816950 RepID=A0A975H1X0_9BURK|nr:DNA-binding protein [Ottowia testudinis]QTD44194.1 DNA-binding protein [Ottowia testudinis]
MFTVVETPAFQSQASGIWTEYERLHFIGWLADNPLAGDVIPGADGARKVRWAAQGKGKRGGARVIYFNVLQDGYIVLIAIYTKSTRASLPSQSILKAK